MKKETLELLIEAVMGISGRLLDGSKRNPNIIYNANIIVGKKKMWFGDFAEHECYRLELLSKAIEQPIYVLREMDARFENEDSPKIKNAVYKFGV